LTAVQNVFGPTFLTSAYVTVTKYYNNVRRHDISADEAAAVAYFTRTLTQEVRDEIKGITAASMLLESCNRMLPMRQLLRFYRS